MVIYIYMVGGIREETSDLCFALVGTRQQGILAILKLLRTRIAQW